MAERISNSYFRPYKDALGLDRDPILKREGSFVLQDLQPQLLPGDIDAESSALTEIQRGLVPRYPAGLRRVWLTVGEHNGREGFFEQVDFVTAPGEKDLVTTQAGYTQILEEQDIPIPPPDQLWETNPQSWHVGFWGIAVALQTYFDTPDATVGQARYLAVKQAKAPDDPHIAKLNFPSELRQALIDRGVNPVVLDYMKDQLPQPVMRALKRTEGLARKLLKQPDVPDGEIVWGIRTTAVRAAGSEQVVLMPEHKGELGGTDKYLGDTAATITTTNVFTSSNVKVI